MNVLAIHTDGGCEPNPGLGTWAFIAVFNEDKVFLTGGLEENATNNTMELQAAIEAFKHLSKYPKSLKVYFHLDSQYVLKGMTEWSKGWVKRGWTNAEGKPVKNIELWKTLLKLKNNTIHDIEYVWERGHDGNKYNEMVDAHCTLLRKEHLKTIKEE